MRRAWSLVIGVLAAVAIAPSSAAQQPGQWALTLGFPSAVGVVWQVSSGSALRSDLSWSKALATKTSPEVWTATAGLSALFRLYSADGVTAYAGPRLSWSRTETQSFGTTQASYGVTGLFGAQAALGKRFAVFGEAGLGYTSQSITKVLVQGVLLQSPVASASRWGTTAGVGALLYLGSPSASAVTRSSSART